MASKRKRKEQRRRGRQTATRSTEELPKSRDTIEDRTLDSRGWRDHEVAQIFARALAIAFGCFALLNLFGELVRPGFDANLWWIDLRALPFGVSVGLLTLAGLVFVAMGVAPRMGKARGAVTTLVLGVLIGMSVWNSIVWFQLLSHGTIASAFPLPFSGLVAIAILFVWLVVSRRLACSDSDVSDSRPRSWRLSAVPRVCVWMVALGVCSTIFPLAQIFCFGKTDYRRPAEAIVVFGCLAYADGTPSTSLADRVRTACDLYRQNLAPRLVFSGGPTAGEKHETEVMRDLAIELGVPRGAITLDRGGLDTRATVENTSELFRAGTIDRVLAVSHFYHLPRIKLSYQRQGIDVFTVPAKETRLIRKTPLSVGREVLALWYYYLRPLAG